MERHGKKALPSQVFPGSVMRFPGDPNGPAKEVINCHCIMVQHVLLQGETIDEDGNIIKAKALQTAPRKRIITRNLQLFAEQDLKKQSTASLKRNSQFP